MRVTEAQLVASVCRDSFECFVREFWGRVCTDPLQWNWHMTVVCDALERVGRRLFRGEAARDLVINQPPGTTKSTLVSVLFPIWLWTHKLDACAICGSYSYDPIALKFSQQGRDLVTSDEFRAVFPEIRLREDQNKKGNYSNTANGFRYAVGIGGSVTGLHGDVIVVDDPINPNKSLSDVELDRANHWMNQTLSSRKKDMLRTPTILVMQRLHQNDPTALFLESGDPEHICLPATLEYPVKPTELVSKYVDGLLSPVRHSPAVLGKERKRLGEHGYAGQYGQSPTPAGGGMFKVDLIQARQPPERFKRIVRAWDRAGTLASQTKLGRRSAWTVGIKMALDWNDAVWILDVIRVRLDSYRRERLIHQTAKRDGRHVEVGVEQEPGSGGKDQALATVKRLQGFRVRVLPASGKKETRAEEFSVQVNAGNVAIPIQFRPEGRWADWAAEYLEELRHWPFSTFKDQGDASAVAYTVLSRNRPRVGTLRMKRTGVRAL